MSREEMRKLMEAVGGPNNSFTEDAGGLLSYKGYPVYALDDEGSESWAYFAFAGTEENLQDLKASLKGGKTKASWEEEPPVRTSRPYDRGKLRLREVDFEEGEDLTAVPVVKSFTPSQLNNIRGTFKKLLDTCEKMNPHGDFSL